MNKKNRKFKGLAISSGKVVAQVCVYSARRHIEVATRIISDNEGVKEEIARFDKAVAICSAELDTIALDVAKKVGEAEAEIFTTQKHILNDPGIGTDIKNRIMTEKINVEAALSDVFRTFEEKFANLDNQYFNDRSNDLSEIRKRLLDHLSNTRPGFGCEGQEHCSRGRNRIIVAHELTADMMVHMNLNHVRGILTEHGGFTSHAAIIARSVGVPAVSGVQGIYENVFCGQRVLVDGDNGIVILDPDEETILRSIPAEAIETGEVCLLNSPAGTQVMANASMLEDVAYATTVRADGIGLFRTEISFIRAERVLSENEQYDLYSEALVRMGGKPVTFRLLDIGGDKELPFLQTTTKESNPFLGLRGARFLLANTAVFTPQVRALVRLSRIGKVHILLPMIIDSVQIDKFIKAIREIMTGTDCIAENVLIGAMFEVPSACLQADTIFKAVDFGSIGSNDLIQYLFAVDRNNESVSQEYNPEHPILWDVLRQLADSSKRTGKPLSICGEMAGREQIASRLLDAGITSLSVSPRLIPRVRNEMARHLATAGQ